ncbi:hypothetical protein QTI66_36375 [Variovorax sp. J22R133]|uniref:hypothetical protein n=1 Tax=Variovorax brevis TaxID=3053503 RepID=UPI002576012A|nr:hypothetical protein [Variovorax sp. J22R133]MDM0117591.1 hypothetical protein [Variovorax sp. J22R133]
MDDGGSIRWPWISTTLSTTVTQTSVPKHHLERAAHAIEQAVHEIFEPEHELPFTAQTDLMLLSPNEQDLVVRAEKMSYQAQPAESAVKFCLTSAASLLAIAHSLLDDTSPLSCAQRERIWKDLAEDSKIAGRAAYRAALILSDPNASANDDVLRNRAPAPQSSEVQQQIAQREKVLEKSRLYRHWSRIKADKITASQFIEFLRPLADLDGVCVSYIYEDKGGEERIYNQGNQEVPGNPMVDAICKKELTLEKAMTFALNEQGKVWIESIFL